MRRLLPAVCVALALAGCTPRSSAVTVARGPATTLTPTLITTVPVTLAPTTTTRTPPTAQVAVALDVTRAEAGIRDPATPADQLATLGRAQQEAYRTLVPHPEWDGDVLALVPDRLRPVVEANLTAGRDLTALTAEPTPDRPMPRWRIVAPDPPDELLALYTGAGAASGVPWQYLAAIHFVETRMGRIKGDSTAGAQGPMQFLASTWASYGQGGDISSNHDAVYAAARFLRANGAPGDMAHALRAYNNSPRYVRAITEYAEQMVTDERAYLGYHAWEVYYGPRLLPPGTVTG